MTVEQKGVLVRRSERRSHRPWPQRDRRRPRLVALGASIVVCATVLGATPYGAAATTARRTRAYAGAARTTCVSTAKTQLAMDQCAEKQLKAVERQLAGALRSEGKHYDKGLVSAAQQQWTAYRSAECRLEASPDRGSTIYPLTYATCELGMTKARLLQVAKATATSN